MFSVILVNTKNTLQISVKYEYREKIAFGFELAFRENATTKKKENHPWWEIKNFTSAQ